MVTFESHIASCASDIYDAVAAGKYTLEMQVRAYDLLDCLLIMKENGETVPPDAAAGWLRAYEQHRESLEELVDETALKAEAADCLNAYSVTLEKVREKAEKAAGLHELAKETFRIWQSSGLFARQRALHKLRRMAGFRLESHRIGNYVAKTYDLMEDARRAYQKAHQAMFSANVEYKCRADIHSLIAREIR